MDSRLLTGCCKTRCAKTRWNWRSFPTASFPSLARACRLAPFVPPVFAARTVAAQAVNSDRREDILIWRYKKEHLEELCPFAETLVGFATHFIPAVQEGAARVGLLPQRGKKRGMFGR